MNSSVTLLQSTPIMAQRFYMHEDLINKNLIKKKSKLAENNNNS